MTYVYVKLCVLVCVSEREGSPADDDEDSGEEDTELTLNPESGVLTRRPRESGRPGDLEMMEKTAGTGKRKYTRRSKGGKSTEE